MAAGKQLMKEIYDQFLVCQICFEIYQRPKTLICLHTFCCDCIEKHFETEYEHSYRYLLYNRKVSCPICRQKTDLPTGGVRCLPDNFLVSNLSVVVSRRKPRENEHPFYECEICKPSIPRRQKQAISKCLDCVKLLCQKCVKLHRSTHVTETHSLFDIEVEKDIECKVHDEEVVRFYCENCEECICVVCTFQDHKGHDISTFSEGMNKYQNSLGNIVSMCRDHIDNVKSQIDVIAQCEQQIKTAEDEIRDMTINSISGIRKNEKKLLDELRETYGDHTLDFIKEKGTLKEKLDDLQSAYKLTDSIVRDKKIEILLLRKQIEEKVKGLLGNNLIDPPLNTSKQVKVIPGRLEYGYLDISDEFTARGEDELPPINISTGPETIASQTGIKGIYDTILGVSNNIPLSTERVISTGCHNKKHITSSSSSPLMSLPPLEVNNKVTQTLSVQTQDSFTMPILPATPMIRSRFTMTVPTNVKNSHTMTSEAETTATKTQTLSIITSNQDSNTDFNSSRESSTDNKYTNTHSPPLIEQSTITMKNSNTDQKTDTLDLTSYIDKGTAMYIDTSQTDQCCMTDRKITFNQFTITEEAENADKMTLTTKVSTAERQTMTNSVIMMDMGINAKLQGFDKATSTKTIVTVNACEGDSYAGTTDKNVETPWQEERPKQCENSTMYERLGFSETSTGTENGTQNDQITYTDLCNMRNCSTNTHHVQYKDSMTETNIMGESTNINNTQRIKLEDSAESCKKQISFDELQSVIDFTTAKKKQNNRQPVDLQEMQPSIDILQNNASCLDNIIENQNKINLNFVNINQVERNLPNEEQFAVITLNQLQELIDYINVNSTSNQSVTNSVVDRNSREQQNILPLQSCQHSTVELSNVYVDTNKPETHSSFIEKGQGQTNDDSINDTCGKQIENNKFDSQTLGENLSTHSLESIVTADSVLNPLVKYSTRSDSDLKTATKLQKELLNKDQIKIKYENETQNDKIAYTDLCNMRNSGTNTHHVQYKDSTTETNILGESTNVNNTQTNKLENSAEACKKQISFDELQSVIDFTTAKKKRINSQPVDLQEMQPSIDILPNKALCPDNIIESPNKSNLNFVSISQLESNIPNEEHFAVITLNQLQELIDYINMNSTSNQSVTNSVIDKNSREQQNILPLQICQHSTVELSNVYVDTNKPETHSSLMEQGQGQTNDDTINDTCGKKIEDNKFDSQTSGENLSTYSIESIVTADSVLNPLVKYSTRSDSDFKTDTKLQNEVLNKDHICSETFDEFIVDSKVTNNITLNPEVCVKLHSEVNKDVGLGSDVNLDTTLYNEDTYDNTLVLKVTGDTKLQSYSDLEINKKTMTNTVEELFSKNDVHFLIPNKENLAKDVYFPTYVNSTAAEADISVDALNDRSEDSIVPTVTVSESRVIRDKTQSSSTQPDTIITQKIKLPITIANKLVNVIIGYPNKQKSKTQQILTCSEKSSHEIDWKVIAELLEKYYTCMIDESTNTEEEVFLEKRIWHSQVNLAQSASSIATDYSDTYVIENDNLSDSSALSFMSVDEDVETLWDDMKHEGAEGGISYLVGHNMSTSTTDINENAVPSEPGKVEQIISVNTVGTNTLGYSYYTDETKPRNKHVIYTEKAETKSELPGCDSTYKLTSSEVTDNQSGDILADSTYKLTSSEVTDNQPDDILPDSTYKLTSSEVIDNQPGDILPDSTYKLTSSDVTDNQSGDILPDSTYTLVSSEVTNNQLGDILPVHSESNIKGEHLDAVDFDMRTQRHMQEIGTLKRPHGNILHVNSTKKSKTCEKCKETNVSNFITEMTDTASDPINVLFNEEYENFASVTWTTSNANKTSVNLVLKESSTNDIITKTDCGISQHRNTSVVNRGCSPISYITSEMGIDVKPNTRDTCTFIPDVRVKDTGVSPFRIKTSNKSVSPIKNLIPLVHTASGSDTKFENRGISPIRQRVINRGNNTIKSVFTNRGSSPVRFNGNDFGVMVSPCMSDNCTGTSIVMVDSSTETKPKRTINKCTGMTKVHHVSVHTSTQQIHTMNKTISTDHISCIDKQTMTFDITASYRGLVKPKPPITVTRGTSTGQVTMVTKETSPIRSTFTEKASSPVRVITFDKGVNASKAELMEPKDKFQAVGMQSLKLFRPIADSPKSNLESIEELHEYDDDHASKEIQTETPPRSPRPSLGRNSISALDLSQTSPFLHKEKFVLSAPRIGRRLASDETTFSYQQSSYTNNKMVCKVECSTNTNEIEGEKETFDKETSTPPVEMEDKAVGTEAIHMTKDDKMAACISKLQAVKQRLEQQPSASKNVFSKSMDESKNPKDSDNIESPYGLLSKSIGEKSIDQNKKVKREKHSAAVQTAEILSPPEKTHDVFSLNPINRSKSAGKIEESTFIPFASPRLVRRPLIKQESSDADSEDSNPKLKHSLARKKKPALAQLLQRAPTMPDGKQGLPSTVIPKPKLKTIVPHVIPKLNVSEVSSPRLSRKMGPNSQALSPRARRRKSSPVAEGPRTKPIIAGIPCFTPGATKILSNNTVDKQKARQERVAKLRQEKMLETSSCSSLSSISQKKDPLKKISIKGRKPLSSNSLSKIMQDDSSSSSS